MKTAFLNRFEEVCFEGQDNHTCGTETFTKLRNEGTDADSHSSEFIAIPQRSIPQIVAGTSTKTGARETSDKDAWEASHRAIPKCS